MQVLCGLQQIYSRTVQHVNQTTTLITSHSEGGQRETAEAGIQCNLHSDIKTWHMGTQTNCDHSGKGPPPISCWSNFADWVNDTVKNDNKMTYRQSQRLFMAASRSS